MNKKLFFSAAIFACALTLSSCGNSKKTGQESTTTDSVTASNFDFSGVYQTTPTDTISLGYYQSLSITPADSLYDIVFSASKVNGREGCSFTGKGHISNDTIFVDIDDAENAVMTIIPTKDKLGVEVATLKEDNRMKLNFYCSGGATLAGTYLKNTVSNDHVGAVKQGETIGELLNNLPKEQVKKSEGHGEHAEDIFDDYTIYDQDGGELFVVTPKDRDNMQSSINRVLVKSLMFITDKGISKLSSFGDVIKAYPDYKIEPTESEVVVNAGDNLSFSFDKKNLKEGWWNEKDKTVNLDKIPTDLKVKDFIVWWK
ncbi:hypothetical protein [Falsiporphyromonas endometrii]|uniref:Lipoprotein n=1 Tax=Falsiporphyromonas endometrii TaxID=1387297 RepID=A0ABV9K773_9PORP